jgi:hypothetical protein
MIKTAYSQKDPAEIHVWRVVAPAVIPIKTLIIMEDYLASEINAALNHESPPKKTG